MVPLHVHSGHCTYSFQIHNNIIFIFFLPTQYGTVHRLETNKLRNVAKFFGQLFYADALPWTCMSCIHLNEEETNSSSRIFVKILFQELAEFMGLTKLNERLRDPYVCSNACILITVGQSPF